MHKGTGIAGALLVDEDSFVDEGRFVVQEQFRCHCIGLPGADVVRLSRVRDEAGD